MFICMNKDARNVRLREREFERMRGREDEKRENER
jgi:hypothetical protein